MALFVQGVEARTNDAEMFSAVERTEAARDLLFDLGHIRAIHAELKGAHGSPRMVCELRLRGFTAGKERVDTTD